MRRTEKWRSLFNNNKLLVRLIASFLLTSILSTMLLMFVVSSYISTSVQNKTREVQNDLMRHSYATTYYALTDTYVDFYQLWSKDESIQKVLNESNPSELDLKFATKTLDRFVFQDDLVHSVYVINKEKDFVFSNLSSKQSMDTFHDQSSLLFFKEFEANYDYYKDEIFFPRKTNYNLNDLDESKNYISILYAIKDEKNQLNSGLMVNIDQKELARLLETVDSDASMMIANSTGQIISDSEGSSFASNLTRDAFYSEIANSKNQEDSFIGDYLNEKSFVSYKKASDIGFVFISLTPYSVLMKEVALINRTIAFFFILAMLISLIVSIFSIKKIYEPLNQLINKIKANPALENNQYIDEYAFLEETYDSLVSRNRRSRLFGIFKGNYSQGVEDILAFKKDKFITLALIPDDENYRYPDILEQIINLMEEKTDYLGTMTSSESLSFIINEENFEKENMIELISKLQAFQNLIHEHLDLSVSIGIGTEINSLESVNFSHRYALMAVNYAHSLGDKQIIPYSEIEDVKLAASVNKDTIADKIQAYVHDNYMRQDFSVDEIASELNLSLGYIRQIFKSEKDLTLNEYLISYRIDKAKEMLRESDATAKDISEAVGYYDNRYFYTIFKKRVGMTSEEYRQMEKEALT